METARGLTARRSLAAAALVCILGVAVILRLPGLRSEPWLDEVWSIKLARQAVSASDVFLKIHHDNNNPLNTLYLHFVSANGNWAVDRLLSFFSGLLTIGLLGWEPEDRARGLLAAALAAVSAPMVLYSTEARGYAPLALLALTCFRLLRVRAPLARSRIAAFWLCALLAFLSHPTFIYVFAAFGVWVAISIPADKRLRSLLVLFGPPLAAFVLFMAIQMPGMQLGAASRNPFALVMFRTLALWSGAPVEGVGAMVGASIVLGMIGWELRNLRRERAGEFVYFFALFSGAAAFVAIFPFPFERHFFACLPFVMMLASDGLMRVFRRGYASRVAASVLLTLFVIGNGSRLWAFSAEGRGHYLEAVQRMAKETTGDTITVGSDHDFRNGMMLEFYGAYLPPQKRFEYVPAREFRARMPEWYLLHSFSVDPRTVPLGLTFSDAANYRLIDVYRYGGLNGWTWSLYRRERRE